MATPRKRKNTSGDAANNESIHNCVQCGVIGEINGRLDAQENTDSRIESSIKDLIANHAAERAQSSKDITDLKCELARVGTVLETSVNNQTEMIKQMKDLSMNTAAIHQSHIDTKKMFEKHINESDAWRASIERRVGKLERTKWFWYTLSAILVGMAGFLSYLFSIYDVIIKK